jgi:threonine dehydratase
MSINTLSLGDIYSARQRIAEIVVKTPLVDSHLLSAETRSKVKLKLENLQVTGAFKIRGAANVLLSLSDEQRSRGVITVSSGNHGRAVAYVADKLGVNATICVPETVPDNKLEAIQALGAELKVEGENADAAMEFADILQAERGMTMIHPFDDLMVIAGQGTIGLELLEDAPETDTVIVPLSGGGLMSGIAFAVKAISPAIHVVGVSMERGAAMVESLKAGEVVEIIEEPTLADALAGGLNKDNKFTLSMVQQFVDETLLVSEDEIADAIMYCLTEQRIVVEGGAAVGIAALLSNKVQKLGKNVSIVISGGNISMQVLNELIANGEAAK